MPHPGSFYLRPLLPLTLCLMTGIMLGDALPGFILPAWGILLSTGGGLMFCIRRQKKNLFLPLFLFLSLGYLSIQHWASPSFPPDHVIHYIDQKVEHLTGTIHTSPRRQDRRITFVLKCESVAQKPVSGLTRVSAWGRYTDFNKGDRVVFSGRIRPIRNFANPGGFDYERFMAFQGIWAGASVSKRSLRQLEKAEEPLFDRMRRQFSDIISQTASPRSGAILKALIIGERQAIEPDLREQFSRAGISHILAISGLHMGIVAGFFLICFRWLFSRIPCFLWNGWRDRAALLFTMLPVLAYGWISGMSPSTQRAILMILALVICMWQTRPPDVANTIALAALVILMIRPSTLFSISFQLSFSAVIAIVYGLSRFLSPLPPTAPKSKRIKMWGVGFMLVSLFAILGTLPLSMHYFYQASFVGIIANIIYVPLVGWLVLPLGLSAFCLFGFSEPAAEGILRFCSALLEGGLNILPFFSEMPFGGIRTFPPTWLEIACYYVLVWCLVEWWSAKKKPVEEGGPDNFPSVRFRRILSLVVCLTLAVDGIYWMHHRYWHKDLRMTMIDVGQGSSTLLEFPGGKTLLVDGGGFSGRSTFDVGERIVAPFLLHQRILTLDAVILSHPDSDHLNGLLYILEQFDIREFWSTRLPSESDAYSKLLEILDEKQIPHPLYRQLPRHRQWGEMDMKILYPSPDVGNHLGEDAWRQKSNNGSIVLKVQLGKISLLLPGDIEAPAEKEIAKGAGEFLSSTVLIAPHHGSKTSSSPGFLSLVNPEYIFISAGWKNRFRCPHPKVMKRYEKQGSRIFRTDIDGAVQLSTDGEGVEIRTVR